MTLRITLPFGKQDSVKNLVFSILTKEYPLKLIELTNFIRKRYGRSVTFQAVRKAAFELVAEGVLVCSDHEFSIDRVWVVESKKQLDQLYHDLNDGKVKPKGIDSIQGEISVFTFDSLNFMIQFWEDIIEDWFSHFKKGDPNINCFQGAHGWEGLLHSDREKRIMEPLKEKGIKSYVLSIGATPLDRYIWRFYTSVGLKVAFHPSLSSFDRSYYVATYGETIVQVQYPPDAVVALDLFFKKHKTIEGMNLKDLSDIVNKKRVIKLTVIKNLAMAKQINKSIISQIQ